MFSQERPFCMLIDPSITIHKVIEVMLLRNGSFRCIAFANPVEALAAIHANRIPVPDVALISQNLVQMDGLEVIRTMRQRQYRTAIVFLQNDQDSVLQRVKARIAGANAVVVKPFKVQELHQVLLRALAESSQEGTSAS